jgi:uncharacterized membrane protein YeaQ/YmgE (transglycosylase-associated protein family)
MIIVIWLGIGAFVGWIACLVTHTLGRANCLLNVLAGAGGSVVAGLLTGLAGNIAGISESASRIGSLFVCFCISWVLLALVAKFQPVWYVEHIHYRPRIRKSWG